MPLRRLQAASSFSAYSGGDWRPLRKLLAPVGPADLREDAKNGAYGFRGYADAFQLRAATGSDPWTFTASTPAAVERYAKKRHRQHGTMRLLALDVVRDRLIRDAVSGSIILVRQADDLAESALGGWIVRGKYGFNCKSGTIFTIAVSLSGNQSLTLPCTKPARWSIESPPLACARRR